MPESKYYEHNGSEKDALEKVKVSKKKLSELIMRISADLGVSTVSEDDAESYASWLLSTLLCAKTQDDNILMAREIPVGYAVIVDGNKLVIARPDDGR
jgi:hypothetical protein